MTVRWGPGLLRGPVAVLLVLAIVLLGGCRSAGDQAAPATPPGPSRTVGADGRGRTAVAVEVLRAWDARRAAAYATGDDVALRRLYVAGSRAGERDVGLLRSYLARGLVVRDLRTQLLAVEAVVLEEHRLVLRVRDRVFAARASRLGRRGGVALPRDEPTTRTITLLQAGHRSDGGGPDRWRVSEVREG